MEIEEYLEKAKNPVYWFNYAMVQKKVADKILHSIMDADVLNDTKMSSDLLINAHYHYGIGIENGLKALIIKNAPENVIVEVKGDKARLKGIGKKKKLTHNLLELAEEAGIFELGLHQYETDIKALKMVLRHLTDAIKWLPKYPVPSDNKSSFVFDNSIPAVLIYGFHILDVIEPLFKLFEVEGAECA
ncbi:hypothetical protein [Shewanella livingstonensis]|uniref:Uncharacterized protein n=1 Tax=Shewanella livingstonensis TaxID=150120 RepID=A0A3G8LZC1_9GAMM|nr:hypothetical protein [Shewanella livingstonensis]AZG74774.1 hypothetical protein EGC82_19665 [Shewanella livingstonensis]